MNIIKLSRYDADYAWRKNIPNVGQDGYPFVKFSSNSLVCPKLSLILLGKYCFNIVDIAQLILFLADYKPCIIYGIDDTKNYNINSFMIDKKLFVIEKCRKYHLLMELDLGVCSCLCSNDSNTWFRCENIICDSWLPQTFDERSCCMEDITGIRKYRITPNNGCTTCCYCVKNIRTKNELLERYKIKSCFKCRYLSGRSKPEMNFQFNIGKYLQQKGWREQLEH